MFSPKTPRSVHMVEMLLYFSSIVVLTRLPPFLIFFIRSFVVRERTVSGMFMENDAIVQGGCELLTRPLDYSLAYLSPLFSFLAFVTPFGGIGPSGCTSRQISSPFPRLLHPGTHPHPSSPTSYNPDGAHRGKYSFDTFTHLRPSLTSPKWCVFFVSLFVLLLFVRLIILLLTVISIPFPPLLPTTPAPTTVSLSLSLSLSYPGSTSSS